MRYIKKFLQIVADIVVVLILLFLLGRFGWKLFGYRFCTGSEITAVSVEENLVTVEGRDNTAAPKGCVGYRSSQEGDTLYVGVRYDGICGFFEQSFFSATIPVSNEIQKVYLKTGDSEYLIWDQGMETSE